MDLDTYKNIIECGLSLDRQPPLLPTLIIETDNEIRVALLEPAPEPEETSEVVMQWKQAVLGDQEKIQLHCIGFISLPNEITLGIFPPPDGIWLRGHINASSGTVAWTPNATAK